MITLLQIETTYEVIYKRKEYQITILEDKVTIGYTDYFVIDAYGDEVDEDLKDEIIAYLENNIN
jgi:hypothetical protein